MGHGAWHRSLGRLNVGNAVKDEGLVNLDQCSVQFGVAKSNAGKRGARANSKRFGIADHAFDLGESMCDGKFYDACVREV